MGILTSFVKNGEVRPSVSYKIILEQKKKEINSILERNISRSGLAHFGNKNART